MPLPPNPASSLEQTMFANSLLDANAITQIQYPTQTLHPVHSPFFEYVSPPPPDQPEATRPNMTPAQQLRRKQSERDYKSDAHEWEAWLASMTEETYNRLTPFGRAAINIAKAITDVDFTDWIPGGIPIISNIFKHKAQMGAEFMGNMVESAYREAVYGEPMNIADIMPEEMFNYLKTSVFANEMGEILGKDVSFETWQQLQKDNQWASDIGLSALGVLAGAAVTAGTVGAVSKVPGLSNLVTMGGQALLTANMIATRVDDALQTFNGVMSTYITGLHEQFSAQTGQLEEVIDAFKNAPPPEIIVNVDDSTSPEEQAMIDGLTGQVRSLEDLVKSLLPGAGVAAARLGGEQTIDINIQGGHGGAAGSLDSGDRYSCPIGTHWDSSTRRCVPNSDVRPKGTSLRKKRGHSSTGALGDVTQNTRG